MHPSRRQPAHAYTLTETALVLFGVTVIAALAALSMGGTKVLTNDRTSQAAIDLVITAAFDHATITGTINTNAAALTETVPTDAAPTNGPSTQPGQVSIASTATQIGAAAEATDGSCWYAYRAVTAHPNEPLQLHAFSPTTGTTACTGHAALTLTHHPPTGRGNTWSNPIPLP